MPYHTNAIQKIYANEATWTPVYTTRFYFLPGFVCDLMTLFTIFASSTKNARMMLLQIIVKDAVRSKDDVVTYRDLTQSPHREPP